MGVDSLKKLFEVNHSALLMNVKDLTHEESLIQPSPAGNCLNWVAGHIVASRNQALALLGEEPIWSAAEADPYKRGSSPIRQGDRALALSKILADFELSQGRIRAGLGRITQRDLEEKLGDKTAGESLHFLHFHEAYHIGQVGLLRRMAGKEGAIR